MAEIITSLYEDGRPVTPGRNLDSIIERPSDPRDPDKRRKPADPYLKVLRWKSSQLAEMRVLTTLDQKRGPADARSHFRGMRRKRRRLSKRARNQPKKKCECAGILPFKSKGIRSPGTIVNARNQLLTIKPNNTMAEIITSLYEDGRPVTPGRNLDSIIERPSGPRDPDKRRKPADPYLKVLRWKSSQLAEMRVLTTLDQKRGPADARSHFRGMRRKRRRLSKRARNQPKKKC
ncbi:hypothetical protein HHI36_016529 [Cryptolaemus montrouzieri]|uniref:Uncharacterized protein n=1 Tax=Cryptolaemus montrouzieri TaxID=559131 RepID=A0ABD2NK37_9CUCU